MIEDTRKSPETNLTLKGFNIILMRNAIMICSALKGRDIKAMGNTHRFLVRLKLALKGSN